jgi:hypothetical protein
VTEGWAPDDRPPLREPDRFVFDGLRVPSTEALQRADAQKLVRRGVNHLTAGKAQVLPYADTLEQLVEAVNLVWRTYARRGRECPPLVLWSRAAGKPVYAARIPEQTPGLFGGGPNQLLAPPGAFYELAVRILAAGLSPRMIAVANEGWGVNRALPQARLDEIERDHQAGRLRLGNLPPHERAEMWSVYAQRLDPAEETARVYLIDPGPPRALEPVEAGAAIKSRFAPLLAGTASAHALEDGR